MSGYRFIAPAASSAASSTPGSGGYGFSLDESLYVASPARGTGVRPAAYAGMPASAGRRRGPVIAPPHRGTPIQHDNGRSPSTDSPPRVGYRWAHPRPAPAPRPAAGRPHGEGRSHVGGPPDPAPRLPGGNPGAVNA